MTTAEAIELIRGAVPDHGSGGVWGDLGAGSGTFSLALAELLGPDGRVLAVDREPAAIRSLEHTLAARTAPDGRPGRAAVEPVLGDFRDPEAVPALVGRQLGGALFANALHFDPDPGTTLRRVSKRVEPGGRLVVVEYEDRPPNPWVPHPLPLARLREIAAAEGFLEPRAVGERPSSYGGVLYCAWTAAE